MFLFSACLVPNEGRVGELILQWDNERIEKALSVLQELFTNEEVQERLPRLKKIHRHATSYWHEYVEHLGDNRVKYLLIAEAPPWSPCGEQIQYVLDPKSHSRTLMRALRGAFLTVSKLPADEALAEFARQGFLIIDSIPFSMEYTSNKRKSAKYQELIGITVNAVLEALRASSLRWSRDLRVAFSVKRNALSVIRALGGRLDLNGTMLNLSEALIAVDEAGYPDAEKLRALFHKP
jgi:hypothetical protein